MNIPQPVIRYGQQRLARRIARSIPWVGAVVVLVTIGSRMRRKGMVRGSVDAALDAIPFVGAMKNAIEVVRGRDFFQERAPRAVDSSRGDLRQDAVP
jgi:hypothetical protein